LDTRLEQANNIAEKLAFSLFEVRRKYLRDEMISKARKLLETCRIDQVKCQQGINGLYKVELTRGAYILAQHLLPILSKAFVIWQWMLKPEIKGKALAAIC
jgi:hypothetical protein